MIHEWYTMVAVTGNKCVQPELVRFVRTKRSAFDFERIAPAPLELEGPERERWIREHLRRPYPVNAKCIEGVGFSFAMPEQPPLPLVLGQLSTRFTDVSLTAYTFTYEGDIDPPCKRGHAVYQGGIGLLWEGGPRSKLCDELNRIQAKAARMPEFRWPEGPPKWRILDRDGRELLSGIGDDGTSANKVSGEDTKPEAQATKGTP